MDHAASGVTRSDTAVLTVTATETTPGSRSVPRRNSPATATTNQRPRRTEKVHVAAAATSRRLDIVRPNDTEFSGERKRVRCNELLGGIRCSETLRRSGAVEPPEGNGKGCDEDVEDDYESVFPWQESQPENPGRIETWIKHPRDTVRREFGDDAQNDESEQQRVPRYAQRGAERKVTPSEPNDFVAIPICEDAARKDDERRANEQQEPQRVVAHAFAQSTDTAHRYAA
jgi:hypothetical protein